MHSTRAVRAGRIGANKGCGRGGSLLPPSPRHEPISSINARTPVLGRGTRAKKASPRQYSARLEEVWTPVDLGDPGLSGAVVLRRRAGWHHRWRGGR